jgi:N-acetylglucosamine kinase-like BadF-type ATPase
VDIDIESFIQIMRSVNSIPHGIVIDVNPILYNKLKEQIFSKAQTGDEEAIEIAKQMEQIIYDNLSMLNNKIINGKTQILN